MEVIHISWQRVYQFKGVTFEHHNYLGPMMLRRKTYEPRNFRNIRARQWAAYGSWLRLVETEREKFRV